MDHEDAPHEPGTDSLSHAEQRVADRLRRARVVAAAAAPDLEPELEDLIQIADMIADAGG